jgi:hypothetical protein
VGDDAREAHARTKATASGWLGEGLPEQFAMALSEPVNVVRPGTYTFVAGPVPEGFAEHPSGLSFPPDSESIHMGRWDIRVEQRPDGRYAIVTIEVLEVVRPYRGLRIWIQ